MRTLTLDRFDALTPRQKDACVALAMGWEFDPDACHGEGRWRRFNADRVPLEATWRPPPYVSHAPDAPDRWRWWGEMIEQVIANGYSVEIGNTISGRRYAVCRHATKPSQFAYDVAEALCRALCAAGKLSHPSDQKE